MWSSSGGRLARAWRRGRLLVLRVLRRANGQTSWTEGLRRWCWKRSIRRSMRLAPWGSSERLCEPTGLPRRMSWGPQADAEQRRRLRRNRVARVRAFHTRVRQAPRRAIVRRAARGHRNGASNSPRRWHSRRCCATTETHRRCRSLAQRGCQLAVAFKRRRYRRGEKHGSCWHNPAADRSRRDQRPWSRARGHCAPWRRHNRRLRRPCGTTCRGKRGSGDGARRCWHRWRRNWQGGGRRRRWRHMRRRAYGRRRGASTTTNTSW
mmetsp:Transcript_2912/g.8256  ORF Transcript_2912/g.8256 Transcript_2912/m.8256 type:complete len:264 (-) Transcript_2912:77-868(-)